jgi:hypothetical protein
MFSILATMIKVPTLHELTVISMSAAYANPRDAERARVIAILEHLAQTSDAKGWHWIYGHLVTADQLRAIAAEAGEVK